MIEDRENPENRRLRERIDLDSQVMVRLGDIVVSAICLNASMGGMLLTIIPQSGIDIPMELEGRNGELYLEQRSGEEKLVIESSFEIIRVQTRTSFSEPFQMAVHFTGLDTTNSMELHRLIRWNSWQ